MPLCAIIPHLIHHTAKNCACSSSYISITFVLNLNFIKEVNLLSRITSYTHVRVTLELQCRSIVIESIPLLLLLFESTLGYPSPPSPLATFYTIAPILLFIFTNPPFLKASFISFSIFAASPLILSILHGSSSTSPPRTSINWYLEPSKPLMHPSSWFG